MTAEVLRRLRAALSADVPPVPTPAGVAAAVLVPLFVRDGTLHLLYTRRSDALAHHSGQIAFPGGRHVATTDLTLLATALRETDEEIGVVPQHVDVLGQLAPIHTLSSNFLITPFVGVIPHPYPFRVNRGEVSEIFSVPVAALSDPATARTEEWAFEGRTLPVVTYRHGGHVIWGATQRITATFLDVLTAITAES